MKTPIVVPSPPAFLDPLTNINACYFYAVPRFFPLHHATSRWLQAIIRVGNVDKMKRKMELQPSLFKGTYYQLLDDPQQLECGDPEVHSLFHKHSVLYLTIVGMAMYFRSEEIVKLLLEYRDPAGEPLYSLTDPQYATHVHDTNGGDFHAYPLSMLILRGGFYKCAAIMLEAGWNPQDPICMPIRRCYERRAYYYHNWLDYTLCLMHDKTLLPIAQLVFHMISDPTLYILHNMPMTILQPDTEGNCITPGIMDVEDLPEDAQMIGTKSLMEVAEDYSNYVQIKERYRLIRDCIKQMVCDGVNPEIMMARALDFDGGYEEFGKICIQPESKTEVTENSSANNNAAAVKRKSSDVTQVQIKSTAARGSYISEPTRVLLHALQMDTKPGGKTPFNQLLDAVSVYLRRNVYIIVPLKKKTSSKKKGGGKKRLKLRYDNQKRDARNAITLLLNLMQLQIEKLEKLNGSLRESKQQKFKHMDIANRTYSKRQLIARTLQRMRRLLLDILLHSGEFVSFVEATFPPYNCRPLDGNVDFQLDRKLKQNLRTIQLELMSDFSTSKTAPRFLDQSDLHKAAQIKDLFLNLRVGNAPKENTEAYVKQNQNTSIRHSQNASDLPENASRDGTVSAQLVSTNNWASSEATTLYNQLSGEAAHYLRNVVGQTVRSGGRVTFVKVKQKLKSKCPEKEDSLAQEKADETEGVEETGEAEETGGAAVALAGPATDGDLAFRLAEQIAELGRCAQTGTDLTPKLVAIYRLLSDLSQTSNGKESQESAVTASENVVPDATATPEELVKPAQTSESWKDQGDRAGATATIATPDRGSLTSSGRRKVKRARGSLKKPWRCGARAGGRKGHQAGHQKIRMFDAPPWGSEFALDSV